MYFDRLQNRYRSSQPLYELNYRLLERFLPDLSSSDRARTRDKTGAVELRLRVVERGRYTTLIEFVLAPLIEIESIKGCQFKMRLCHDARVAEVVEFQGEKHFLAWYPNYPNPAMRARDEKRQVNRLFAETMRYCAMSGICFERITL